MQGRDPLTADAERRAFRCSANSCQRVWWHDGRTALPLPPVEDRYSADDARQWHPCPSCLDQQPAVALLGHRLRRRTVETISSWLHSTSSA